MYNYNYNDFDSILNSGNVSSTSGAYTWTIIALVLAVIGGIGAYYLFVKPDKKVEGKFLNWLKSFLAFKEMLIETILKITYMILAIFITLVSFNLIGTNFVAFLLMLIFGNVILRITYEASLMFIMIWKNTAEINKKMK